MVARGKVYFFGFLLTGADGRMDERGILDVVGWVR